MHITISRFKKLALAAAIALAATLVAPLAIAEERTLNVYNWPDYVDESVLKEFTEKTGIKVNYDVFNSYEVLETKLLAGSSGYDLVVIGVPFFARRIEAGIFQKLDKTKLPNLTHAWDVITNRTATYDPDNAYSVNYLWGTTGIGYS